jgi:hypothetical protein
MNQISEQYLKEILNYNPETGVWTWLVDREPNKMKGQAAGTIESWGYRRISIDCRHYRAHRLAWLYMTGQWPKNEIDHINGVPDDNRWCNLREATRLQNEFNKGKRQDNSCGHRGVYWKKRDKKWVAQTNIDGKRKWLGGFDTKEDASCVYEEAIKEIRGEFYYEKFG